MTWFLKLSMARISSLLLLMLYLVIAMVTVTIVNSGMRQAAIAEAEAKARLILDRNLATHTYFSQDMKPRLFQWTSPFRSQEYFDPSWMSSTYAIRTIDAHFRTLSPVPYYYKECAINARSTENEADDFERSFLNSLNEDAAITFWSGVRAFDGKPFFVALRKGEVVEPSCLRCHGEPQEAPADLVKSYGQSLSFHRKVGDTASAISIRIPLSDAYASANSFSFRLSGMLLAAIGLLFLFQRGLNARFIFTPLSRIREKALEISASPNRLGEEIRPTHGKDLAELTHAFNQMSRDLRRSQDHLEALVSERTRELETANRRLHDSSSRYRLLAESINDVIALTDLDGNFLYLSPSVEKVTGWSPKEVLLNGLDLVHPDDVKAVEHIYQAQREDKSDKILQWRCRFKNGHYGWLETNAHLVTDHEGKPKHFVSSSRDISRRKQTEEALRASEEKFSKVFHASPAPITISDLETGRFTEVNEAFSTVTGYRRNEAIGRQSLELGVFSSRETREALVSQLKKTGRLKNLELEFLDRTGNPVILLGAAEMIEIDRRHHLVCIGIDISDRKRAEQERASLEGRLRQAQKLEAIGTLAGGIAHDFNNILGIIMGYAEISKLSLPRESMAHESIDQVLRATERAGDLVKQILTFSRKSDQEKKPLQAVPIIKEVVKMLRAALPTTIEIQFENRVSPKRDVILADSTEIHQLVMNLCTNAGHAMREKGGVLGIEVASVSFDPEAPVPFAGLASGDYLQLTVSDTGHGIDPSLLDRIFDPYFTTKGPGEGTGLGLAVVHGIVESCGGTVSVSSKPEVGTNFYVYIPELKRECEGEERLLEGLRGGSEHILLVDDEEGLVRAGKMMLEALGYRITEAFSSVHALDVFRHQTDAFDLVITDYTMPHMTGTDLAEELQRLRPGLPIILCTGCAEGISQADAKAYGIRELIMKPLSMNTVAQSIRRVLDAK